MSVPSREEFPGRVIQLVRKKFPLVKIERVANTFAMKVNGHTASLENVYRIVTLRPDEMQQHVNRWIVELLRAAEGTHDQDGNFEQLKERLLPVILAGREDLAEAPIVVQPFIEGLIIGYAIDNDRTISYLSKEHFAKWKMSLDDLHETAMNNLMARSEEMEAQPVKDEQGNINLILFQKLDGYDASRLLLPTLHNALRKMLGSPFCAAVPNRDILLCFRDEPQIVDQLRTQISEDYRSMPHQVSERLFLLTPDGVAPRAD